MLLFYLVRLLCLWALASATLDCFTTTQALTAPGTREGNPIVAFLMKLLGSKWMIVRIAFTLPSIYTNLARPEPYWPAVVVLFLTCVVNTYAVVSNYLLYKAHKPA